MVLSFLSRCNTVSPSSIHLTTAVLDFNNILCRLNTKKLGQSMEFERAVLLLLAVVTLSWRNVAVDAAVRALCHGVNLTIENVVFCMAKGDFLVRFASL